MKLERMKFERSSRSWKGQLKLGSDSWSWKILNEAEKVHSSLKISLKLERLILSNFSFFSNHPFQLHVSQLLGLQCKLYITENVKHQLIVTIDGSVKSQYLVCSIRTWNCILRQHLHFTRIRSPKYTCHRTVRFVPIRSTIFMLHTLEKWFIIDVYLLKLLFRIIISFVIDQSDAWIAHFLRSEFSFIYWSVNIQLSTGRSWNLENLRR